jgi:hypothetical protein
MKRTAGQLLLPAFLVLTGGASVAAAPLGVRVERTGGVTVAGRTISSSTALLVSWAATRDALTHHFEVVATENVQGTIVRATAPAGASSVTLTGLKAQTTYAVVVKGCLNEACSQSSDAEAVSAETDREHWQLIGTGSSVSGLTKIVSDGNARLSATRFGPDAGDMANRVQLYYGPMGGGRQSPLAVAVSPGAATAGDPATYLSFSSRSGSSGLISPSTATALVQIVATGQGVPIVRERGAFVRLFFEAQGADGRTRTLWVDSKDGFYGQDFNAGAAVTCSTAADYSAGGGCEPTVAIGVEGDATGNRRITNARQQKVAWPTLDAPHWDLAAGTFMVFTTDRVTGCSDSPMNHGYAVWDGSSWGVQYQADGCPKLFKSAQAAFPFHSGGARYRLYYGDPSITDGRTSSNLPFLGPKKLIYADGSATGQGSVVDFEDWEAQASARDVVFLWPTGDELDARAEGYIDDYHFLAPTGTLDLQVMYITITDGAIPPIAVAARLINP